MYSSKCLRFCGSFVGKRYCGTIAGKPSSKIVAIQEMLKERLLKVNFADGLEAKYSFTWLRENAPEPNTIVSTNKCRNRTMLLADLNPNITPSKNLVTDEGDLIINWPDQTNSVKYSSEWLRSRNLGFFQLRQNRSKYYMESFDHFGSKDLLGELENPADWNLLFDKDHEEYLMTQLQRLLKFGIIRCINVPMKEGQIKEFGKLLGYLQFTYYGDHFVIAKSDYSNVACSNKPLGLHTDLPNLDNALEVQMLHVIKQASGEGGANQFCDGFQVAHQLKMEEPKAYEMLTTVPVEFIDHISDVDDFEMVSYKPIISLNKWGLPDNVFYSNHLRSWFFDLPPEKVPEMYDSLKAFHDYCWKDKNLAEIKLNSGEMVIFSNNRVLHGRSGFKKGAERCLESGFFTFDTVKSKIRVIQRKLSPDTAPITI